MEDRWLSVDEIAAYLGIKRDTVYKWIAEKQMPGTAIALRRKDNTGTSQRTPDFILSITYPTADVQTALRAVSTDRSKRPIVLMGNRGRGKSHIMAVMHHAVESSA